MLDTYYVDAMASSPYQLVREQLARKPQRWLVTGAAGFIGSHLVEALLELGQQVHGLDNFLTGHQHNLDLVQRAVGDSAWRRFRFTRGDIRDRATCLAVCRDVDYVLHQAALGSVPRSIDDPMLCSEINIQGFLQLLTSAREQGVRRVVYASSSAVYGDHPLLPKREEQQGAPLSPYALSKAINEMAAAVFQRCYQLPSVGLRYFNVFGPRQDPHGAYAAVIPLWINAMLRGQQTTIYGDGESSRDFCFVGNVVQANLLAALSENPKALNQVYNIALGGRTTLNQLWHTLHDRVTAACPGLLLPAVRHAGMRSGDIAHSQADIGKAGALLGYLPSHDLQRGLQHTMSWYLQQPEWRSAPAASA